MAKRSDVVANEDRLYHLGVAPIEVARSIFLVGDPKRAYRVGARFDSIEHEVKNREFITLTGTFRGVAMSVVGTGIGTDNVEIALIELDAATGIDLESGLRRREAPSMNLIRIGTSGGVQPDIAAGTLCNAEYALGLDSTGIYYESPPADETVVAIEREGRRLLTAASLEAVRFGGRIPLYASKADPTVSAALARRALEAGVPVESGITVSSPGFYGPSSRYIAGLVNTIPDIKGTLAELEVAGRRVLNMEMESSLLFHLASVLGHRAGTICPAISQPGSQADLVDYESRIEDAIGIAFEAMIDLHAMDGE